MEKTVYNPFQEIHESISDLKKLLSEQKILIHKTPEKEIFNFQETCGFLDIVPTTLYRYVSKRQIPFHKKFNKLYFYREELINWILNREN